MSFINNISKRLNVSNDGDSYQYYDNTSLTLMQKRLNKYGGTDQWTRMRQDKLRGLKNALLYSYQSAIVQKYDVSVNTLAGNIISIITSLQDKLELNDAEKAILDNLEKEYNFLITDRNSFEYIVQLNEVVDKLTSSQPMFRCLINHDKLKVDYEDKIISIPFREIPVGEIDEEETGFHNGTVFKWVHGNKEEWTPDTYWIVYMQYSEQTAYFRGEIRKADEEIQIIIIDDQGNESSAKYRGWMTGPNETSVLWNVKKGFNWNDLNYTKILYITKDEDTLAFFQRFDRLIINGKPWQVQAYNESYSTNSGIQGGIIRVALKEAYTSTDQFVRQSLNDIAAAQEKKAQYDIEHIEPRIDGPSIVRPYETITYTAKNFTSEPGITRHWSLLGTNLAKIIKTSADGLTVTIEILTGTSNKKGFFINYGDAEETMLNVTIKSF